jgi:DNA-binding MarR family transcriptional regulator
MTAPLIEPWDLSPAQASALRAIARHPAWRVFQGWRCRGREARISKQLAGRLLDYELVERRTAQNGTPFLRLTEAGRAVVHVLEGHARPVSLADRIAP